MTINGQQGPVPVHFGANYSSTYFYVTRFLRVTFRRALTLIFISHLSYSHAMTRHCLSCIVFLNRIGMMRFITMAGLLLAPKCRITLVTRRFPPVTSSSTKSQDIDSISLGVPFLLMNLHQLRHQVDETGFLITTQTALIMTPVLWINRDLIV